MVFWKDPLDFSIVSSDEQQLTVLQSGSAWPLFNLSFVYAKCSVMERQALWTSLLLVHSKISGPWLVAGDFNCIMKVDEKLGGNPPHLGAISDFNECVSDCALIDAGFIGSQYTWHNNQAGCKGIWARLDRVLINSDWLNQFPISVEHLSREASDHAPLLVKLLIKQKFQGRFCFQKMWTLHDKFLIDLSTCWNTSPLASSSLSTLYLKLKHVRSMLRNWNKHTFGHVHLNLMAAEDAVLRAELAYDLHPTMENHNLLEKAKSIQSEKLLHEECFWRQKSGIRWLKEGDRNTIFSSLD